MSDHGIISLANAHYEWLIPWWFHRIREVSSLPIHIIDIGLSPSMKKWCDNHATREELIVNSSPASPEEVDPILRKKWESIYFGNVWENRPVWFAKPGALLLSPFSRALFLDLDCEVKANIEDIFNISSSFAICKEPPLSHKTAMHYGLVQKGEVIYNSGVIVFSKETPILKKWAHSSYKESNKYMGDQDLLSSILMQEKSSNWSLLKSKYNCRPHSKMAKNATILHHVGLGGKRDILATILENSF